MVVDRSHNTDGISVALNEPDEGPPPGHSGPDPEQWPVEDRKVSRRKVDRFEEAEKGVKGPHPDEWGDEAREARGADRHAEPVEPDAEG